MNGLVPEHLASRGDEPLKMPELAPAPTMLGFPRMLFRSTEEMEATYRELQVIKANDNEHARRMHWGTVRHHFWYLELVARSKGLEVLGHEPSDAELKEHVVTVTNGDGLHAVHGLVFDGELVLQWNVNTSLGTDPTIFKPYTYMR